MTTFAALPGELPKPSVPAAPIAVEFCDRWCVQMTGEGGAKIKVQVWDDGIHTIHTDSGIVALTTTDLRRLADTVDAVRQGTWQPNPPGVTP